MQDIVLIVGPNGQQGKLERAALLIDDLRLRPEVLFNFLAIDAAVREGERGANDSPRPAVDGDGAPRGAQSPR